MIGHWGMNAIITPNIFGWEQGSNSQPCSQEREMVLIEAFCISQHFKSGFVCLGYGECVCGGVRMRVVWRGYCLPLLAPFPLEAVFTVFLDSMLLVIRHSVWDEQGWWVGQTAKQVHVLQEKPNCFLRGCFSEMEGCASLALADPVPSLECCHLEGWRDSSFSAGAWGAVERSWKRVALLLLVCSSRKWRPHQVGNGLQTSHISWKKISQHHQSLTNGRVGEAGERQGAVGKEGMSKQIDYTMFWGPPHPQQCF